MTTSRHCRARCLCGAVKFSIDVANPGIGACHCSMCRRWGGGPLLVVNGGSSIHIDDAAPVTVHASSDWADRGFCAVCGTHLFYRFKAKAQYFVPVGLFDDQTGWLFDHQIFIDHKPDYYDFANPTHNLTEAEVFVQFQADEP